MSDKLRITKHTYDLWLAYEDTPEGHWAIHLCLFSLSVLATCYGLTTLCLWIFSR